MHISTYISAVKKQQVQSFLSPEYAFQNHTSDFSFQTLFGHRDACLPAYLLFHSRYSHRSFQ